MNVKYLGHSVVLIESKGKRLIIDPFISGNPQSPISVKELPKIDYVVVTHGHGDHVGDTVEIAKRDNATVISNFELCNYLQSKGVQTHPMHIGGAFTFDIGRIKLTPAFHGSSVSEGDQIIYAGMPAGVLIDSDGKKLYHAGDTGLTVEMQLLKDEQVDVAFLPIGGNFVMDEKDAIRAVKFILPKKVVPIHYNTWDIIKADVEYFKNEVEKIGVQCVVMKGGDTLEI
ncbi:metal-dependent hydrolase [Mesoaciditoga sp.]